MFRSRKQSSRPTTTTSSSTTTPVIPRSEVLLDPTIVFCVDGDHPAAVVADHGGSSSDDSSSSSSTCCNKDDYHDIKKRSSPSKKKKKKYGKKKKPTHSSRSVSERLRLWLLTTDCRVRWRMFAVEKGGLRGGVVSILLVLGLLGVTCLSSHQILDSLWSTNNNNNTNLLLTNKPIMVGMYFGDISSHSFSGIVKRIQVPTNNDQWRRLLQKRLDDLTPSQKEHLHSNGQHHHSPLSVVVKPMSKRLDEIQEESEDYEENKPDYTPHPDRCKPQYDWQIATYPTCNTIHERTMMSDRFSLYSSSSSSSVDAGNEHQNRREDNGTTNVVVKKPQQLQQHGGFFVPRRRLGQQQQQQQQHHHQSHDHATKASKATKALNKKQKEHEQMLQQQFKLLGHGYWRDTWMFQRAMPATTTRSTMRQQLGEDSRHQHQQRRELVAFKTTKYNHDLSEYVLDKQRRDSVTSDRLQFSDHSIKMYAHCGSSAMYEWAPGGDMETFIESYGTPQQFVDQFSIEERFQLAYNVTMALNDLHTTEGPDRPPAIVHADFRADQFVSVTPVDWQTGLPQIDDPHKLPQFKLGDFNLARFAYWNTKFNHPCTIETEADGGEFRAPEEYNSDEEGVGTTERLDIYSLGNLLYTLLTGHWPFDDMQGADDDGATHKMKKLVRKGQRPHINIDADYSHDPDPRIQALVEAIHWCWEQDPHDRPTAQQVEDLLADHLPKSVLQERLPHDHHPRRPLKRTL